MINDMQTRLMVLEQRLDALLPDNLKSDALKAKLAEMGGRLNYVQDVRAALSELVREAQVAAEPTEADPEFSDVGESTAE
jgi:predicted thioredoxin/glutaredoxin